MDKQFDIHCDTSHNPPKAYLNVTIANLEVLHISDTQLRVRNNVAQACPGFQGDDALMVNQTNQFFSISETANEFTFVGCHKYVNFIVLHENTNTDTATFIGGCVSLCSNREDVRAGACSGIGCCRTSFPRGSTVFYALSSNVSVDETAVWAYSGCNYVFLGEKGKFNFKGLEDLENSRFAKRVEDTVPMVLEWTVRKGMTCKQALEDRDNYVCQGNSRCIDFDGSQGYHGYRCQCLSGYSGNAYLSPGCTDIDECAGPSNTCVWNCINTPGGYNCTCPDGYHGNGTRCHRSQTATRIALGLGIALGSIIIFIVGFLVNLALRKRRQIKQKTKYFERNGGLLLEQQMTSNQGVVERTKVFTSDELEKATDHFNENRILGQGGQGTVFKGMLPDGRIVAIKKSKKLDGSQLQEFINEVVILSQINHRNIVKLFGCCLETEVPLLVYEFIPNGTLYDHIHYPHEEFRITWEMRLHIATDVAGALAYLHSDASKPIYHRDIKSSNILLDEKYRAKVSDFGTSRSMQIDQTHLTTQVHGTFGYLDPEYFRSHQFTEKSDVYSFGVVLAELLTGQKAIRQLTSQEGKSLATWFLSSLDNSSFHDLIDSQVLKEGKEEELIGIANLAKRCLNLDGKQRPTMKEVLQELVAIRSHQEPSPSSQPNVPRTDDMSVPVTTLGNSCDAFYTTESYSEDFSRHSLLWNSPR